MPVGNRNRNSGLPRIDPTIAYWLALPHDNPHQTSILQGFPARLFALMWALEYLVDLPADALEPALPHSANLARRIGGAGGWRWIPVYLDALEMLEIPPENPFWVVFCGTQPVAERVSS